MSDRIRIGLLRLNQGYVQEVDHLIKATVHAEQLRAKSLIRSVDEVRLDLFAGDPLRSGKEFVSRTAKYISRAWGAGSKAVGPWEELDPAQKNLSTFRYTHKRKALQTMANSALASVETNDRIGPIANKYTPATDPNKIGIFDGPSAEELDEINARGPYSAQDGKLAIDEYRDEFLTFTLENLAIAQKDLAIKSFPAYIRSLNETMTTSWNSISTLGRSEDLFFYDSAQQNLNMDFFLFATHSGEKLPDSQKLGELGSRIGYHQFDPDSPVALNQLISEPMSMSEMYDRLNFIKMLGYPAYDADDNYSRAPFAILNLGAMFEDQLIVMESVNYSFDPLIWDLNDVDRKRYRPTICTITIAVKLLHRKAPGILDGGKTFESKRNID